MLRWLYDRLYPSMAFAGVPIEMTEGVKAKAEADCEYRAAVARRTAVTSVTTKLQAQLQENHFAEMISATMRGNG